MNTMNKELFLIFHGTMGVLNSVEKQHTLKLKDGFARHS